MYQHIKKCMDNMAANAELYRKIADTKCLQEYSEEYRLAKAQQEAWHSASNMLNEAIKMDYEIDNAEEKS